MITEWETAGQAASPSFFRYYREHLRTLLSPRSALRAVAIVDAVEASVKCHLFVITPSKSFKRPSHYTVILYCAWVMIARDSASERSLASLFFPFFVAYG